MQIIQAGNGDGEQQARQVPPVLITAQGAGEDLDRTYYMGIGLEGGELSGCHTLEISPIMPSDETQSGLRPTNKNDKCHEIYSSQH